MRTSPIKAYAQAGVDVDFGNTLKRGINRLSGQPMDPRCSERLADSEGSSERTSME